MARGRKPTLPIYVLRAKSNAEWAVQLRLRAIGVHTHIFQYLVDGVARALFPTYMFARVEQGWQFGAIARTRGVLSFVSFGDGEDRRYAVLPQRDFDELRALETEFGYLRLGPRFNRWARVRLVDRETGAAGASVGIVQRRESATMLRVLFSLLGRGAEMSVAERDLVAA